MEKEEILQHYHRALASVRFLENDKPEYLTEEDWEDAKKRNIEHLQLMLEKDFWKDEDLTPLKNAIK